MTPPPDAAAQEAPAGTPEAGYTLLTKTTAAFTAQDFAAYGALFQAVFGKARSEQELRQQFGACDLGYAYHVLMLHPQDGLVGAYTVLPERYRVEDREVLFGLSVDTMVHPDHRNDPLHFKRMADLCYARMASDGVALVFGFPNENSRTYFEKVLRWKRMGEMPFHALPLRLSRLVPALGGLDGAWRALLRAGLWAVGAFAGRREPPASIHTLEKETAEACLTLSGRKACGLPDRGHFVHSVHAEAMGLRVAYLVDVRPLCRRSICQALSSLMQQAPDADLAAYVGPLPFRPIVLARVPEARNPRRIFMSGRILRPDLVAPEVMDLSRWRVNLASFDVR